MAQDIFQPQESYKSLNSLHLRWKYSGAGGLHSQKRGILPRSTWNGMASMSLKGVAIRVFWLELLQQLVSWLTARPISGKSFPHQWLHSERAGTNTPLYWSDVADGFYVVRRSGRWQLVERGVCLPSGANNDNSNADSTSATSSTATTTSMTSATTTCTEDRVDRSDSCRSCLLGLLCVSYVGRRTVAVTVLYIDCFWVPL